MTRKLLLIFALLAAPLLAQQAVPFASQQPDCYANGTLTAASSGTGAAGTVTGGSVGTTRVIDNRLVGCVDWIMAYQVDGFTAVTLRLQDAPVSATVPGTWENYAGTVTGINPGTAITQGVVYGSGDPYPFLRVNLTAVTGTGAVTVQLYGWKRRPLTSASGPIIAANSSAVLEMSTATTTEMIALVTGKAIYISAFAMEAGGTTTATLKYGSGTNCGTGTTTLGAAWEWTAQTGIARGTGLGILMTVPAGKALCVTNSQAVTLHVEVAYAQQ